MNLIYRLETDVRSLLAQSELQPDEKLWNHYLIGKAEGIEHALFYLRREPTFWEKLRAIVTFSSIPGHPDF